MSRIPSNGQPTYTHEYIYILEELLEMYDIEDLPNGTLPLKCTNIYHYQREYSGI